MPLTELFRPPREPSDARPSRLDLIVLAATLVAATTLLTVTFHQPSDSVGFTIAALATAAVWLIGGLAVGQVRLGSVDGRVLVAASVVGLACFGFFAAMTLGARVAPGLSNALEGVLDKADAASTTVVLTVAIANALAEEVYFRGAVTGALPPRLAGAGSVIIYVVVTCFTGNVALVVAAALMGAVFALERRGTGGIAASAITHVVWSILMVVALPR
jgi:membrane protease YdiL (CAAX protease family)